MVVAQYPFPVLGGLERQAHELAKALVPLGIHVEALSGRVRPEQASIENVEGIRVYRLAWFQRAWLRFVFTPFSLFGQLFRLRDRYDVIHLHQHSWFGLFTILAAWVLGKPILTKLCNVGEWGLPGLRTSRLGNLKMRILLRSDAVVAMCQQSIDELADEHFPLQRTLAVPNGIRLALADAAAVAEPRVTESMVAMSDQSKQRPCRAVFVGRIADEKQPELLLRAWQAAVSRAKNPAVLEFWGTGPLQATAQDLCEQMSLSDSVVFRGHVNTVRDWLPNMDMFVMASRVEGNSNSILEAMAAGLAIVGTRVGGTAMQVGPRGAELLCEPNETNRLADHMLRLIDDPAMRASLGSAMRERIEELFAIEQIAPIYANAYQLLHKHKREQMQSIGHRALMGSA